ncbi:hypothetical protein ACMFKE_04875 [Staphylococcus haemolyticus]|uniref:hypothetical protein n=1 Tax=Staphylococcus haemolyticus TaxID=1283 RepID=UPI0039BD69F2
MNSMNWGETVLTILGSGSFSTVVTYLINKGFNNKKLHAEIISKARIDWISNFRKISSSYLYEASEALSIGIKALNLESELSLLSKNTSAYRMKQNEIREITKLYNKQVAKMTETFIQMRLFLPDRKDGTVQNEHKRIKDYIGLMHDYMNEAMVYNDVEILKKIQRHKIKFLTDYIAKYLKKEWDRAKAKE